MQEDEQERGSTQFLMQELLVQMKALTFEVKYLREQLEVQEEKEDPVLVLEKSEMRENSPPRKKHKAVTIISNIMFYIIIITIVVGAFLLRSSKNGKPFMIGGYSAMTVLTGSMEDVYPKGSLIITKSVDANQLKIGDDITFMTGETTSITHRIIGITENYADTKKRGFETQGIMNAKPDKDVVAASNVVGRVIFHSKTLGDVAAYITGNWPFLLFVVIVLVMLLTFLQWNAKRTEKEEVEQVKTKDKEGKSRNEK